MTSGNELMRDQHEPIMAKQDERKLPLHFGNYELVHRIDVGGMGEVYLARQRTAFDREVAIKIIRSDLIHDMTARARFLREAEVSAHLKHDHILPLIEFGEEQGRLFLVTPYIEGGTLARRLHNGPLSLAEVYRLFTALVHAVTYIHRRGVIHRDLKPTNILLDQEDGQLYVRLIDFGIATLQGRPASPPLTTAGTEMGTVAYMAPERLSGISAPSNDIYSLGVILYQLLTGHLPSVEHHTRLPQPLKYVIHRCVAPNPEDRFATAEELLKAFEQAYQQLTRAPEAPSPPPLPRLEYGSSTFIKSENMPHKTTHPVEMTSRPQEESVLLEHSGAIPAATPLAPLPPLQPQQQNGFIRADYAAPTTSIGTPESSQKPAVATAPPPAKPFRPRRRRKRSLMTIISMMIFVILLVIAGLTYFEFKTFTVSSATVSFGPQVHVINQVYTITARPAQQTSSVSASSIPAKVLSSTRSNSQSGPTTGQQCVLGIFDCRQTVNASDVSNLADQIRPNLTSQITQDLQRQIHNLSAHAVGTIHFADLSETANPPVGSVSPTVTVTLKVQGSIEYILNADAQNLARQLLTQQSHKLGSNYILLNSTIRIGQPVVESLDETTGIVTIKIAAAGVSQYQFPTTQIQAINNALKGKSLKAARTFLLQQPGVDPSTISIRFTSGGGQTLPEDVQHIRIIPLSPTTLPVVNLQAVPTPVGTTSQ